MSLRARIRLLALGAAAAVLLLVAVPLWLLEQSVAADDVEQSATESARGVADYLSAAGLRTDLQAYVERVNGRDDAPPVAVVTPDGRRYGPDLPGADAQLRPGPDGDGDGDGDGDRDGPFASQSSPDVDAVDGGHLVRVVVRTEGGPTTVLAYAADAQVRETVGSRLLPLGLAALVVLALVGLAAEIVARRLVLDLDRTADLADTIAAGDAVARVPEAGPPEVQRVAHALNGLAGRIDELLAAERETAADLSHRLRTPLTALRLDVESLPPGPARAELTDRVDTLERTLTAVIHQARRTDREGARARCAPGPVVAEAAAYWQPLVEDQGRATTVEVGDDLPNVRCAADDLRAALDALLENCIAHTPDRTPIAVVAEQREGLVVVEVRDGGPGFAAEAVGRGRSDGGSSGLGLDIARACARASGGDLVVGRDDGWTVVRLGLGTA
ncbi:HAMP domain-containing sensor histidine kinase [Nocardioides marinquilinus]|uniref:histidine kinase n=1 Tax=Nocardioides marinquilinus TaxID=1210400 RepID=A0ABP9PAX0_9ACTN